MMNRDNGNVISIDELYPVDNIEDIYPMSDVEIGMAYFTLRYPTNSPNHIQRTFYLKRKGFDEERFKRALALMADKHPLLRTGFNMYDFEEPIHIVQKKIPIDLEHHDIAHIKKDEQEEHIQRILLEDRKKSFDVANAKLLWRVKLITCNEEDICVVWIVNHTIIDGWSANSLVVELMDTYQKLKTDPGYVPGKLKSTYKDFVVKQLKEKKKSENIYFWKSQLEGYQRLKFPGRAKIHDDEVDGSKDFRYNMGTSIFSRLKDTAREYNTSLKHLFFAAFFYMLNMLSYENDIVAGLTSNSRPQCEDGDKIYGCFLNITPVRMRIPGHVKWSDYIRMIEKKLLELKQYERLSYLEIGKAIGEATQDQDTICNTLFTYNDFHTLYHQQGADHQPGNTSNGNHNVQLITLKGINANGIFNFGVDATSGDPLISVKYENTMISDELTINLCGYFDKILNIFATQPETTIRKDALMTEKEKQKLLVEFNDTGMDYPEDRPVHQWFQEQVEKTPARAAVVYNDECLTYRELNKRANQLARHLKDRGVDQERVVGLMIGDSPWMIVGMMAVMKMGAAYLPLDPKSPGERNRRIIEENQPQMILVQKQLREENNPLTNQFPREKIMVIDENRKHKGPGAADNLDINIKPHGLIYVMYTSGTTGRPNGILVEHGNLSSFIWGLNEVIFKKYGEWLYFALVTPFTFDGSVKSAYGALMYGHTLVIVPGESRGDGEFLLEFYSKHHIDISDGTPGHIRLMLSHFAAAAGRKIQEPRVKQFTISTDLLETKLVRDFLAGFQSHKPEITNVYGATECCGDSTSFHISPTDMEGYEILPIGKPLPNQQVYILDEYKHLQPIGVFGEVCISGSGVSRGYLLREKLTSEKFVKHPFIDEKRMYRTGDLARWLPDGNLEILGRIDRQVKIRGFRIEPAEIEKILMEYPPVKEAVVMKKEISADNQLLCAYISEIENGGTGEKLVLSNLNEFLSGKLPGYMIPQKIIKVPEIPRKTNGKIDYHALPDVLAENRGDYIPPGNEVERKLSGIWAELLGVGVEKIEIASSVYELGANSLNMMAFIGKVHQEFNVRITLGDVFANFTVKKQAKMIMEAKEEKYKSIQPAESKEYYALSPAQQRLYTLQQMYGENTVYNIFEVHRFDDTPDAERLKEAFIQLIKRHESLRTSFPLKDDEPVQKIWKFDKVNFEIEHCHISEEAEKEQVFHGFVKPFDLENAPLLRVGLVNVKGTEHFLMVNMHHIIADGTSHDILVHDFIALYSRDKLPGLRLHYKDYSEWLNSRKIKETIKKQEKYWLNRLRGEIPVLDMPTDYKRPAVKDLEGKAIDFGITKQETEVLEALAKQEDATLFMVLLALYNIWLSKLSGQSDILIGAVVAGRNHVNLEQIIGVFVNTLVLRNYPKAEETFRQFLKELKRRTLSAFDNQEYPFDNLVEKVVKNRDMSRFPLYDAGFVFQNFPGLVRDRRKPGKTDLNVKRYHYEKETNIGEDLLLIGYFEGEQLSFTLNYYTGLFKKETMERYITYFKEIVKIAIENPGKKLKEIEIVSTEEKDELRTAIKRSQDNIQAEFAI